MDLSTIDNATLTVWYREATEAMHALMTGRQTVSASYSQGTGARSVTYSQANLGDLRQWLEQLAVAMAARSLITLPRPRRRAIGIVF